MQLINKLNLKHAQIQKELRKSIRSVNHILRLLGVDETTTLRDLYRLILDDLENMGFEIKDDPGLCNAHGDQSVPAFTKYHTANRMDGGIIYLNPDCSPIERLETLYHEYIHIKDHSLPIYTTHPGPFENEAAFYNFYLEVIKYQADITSALPGQMKIDILTNANDINKVLGKYNELFQYIFDDLEKMNFKIVYDNALMSPADTTFNTANKTSGGTIKLNPYYSTNEKLEALYSEYVNIIDYSLPIYNMYTTSPEYKVMVDNFYQELVEYQADMRAYTLLMPPEEIKQNLSRYEFNIDEMLRKYSYIEKSSVLQWIAINADLPCHFAWVILEKDNNKNIIRKIVYDSFYYDHKNDPQTFDIEAVLNNADSAAAISVRECRDRHKASNITGKEYFCYAYYETDKSKVVRNNTIPGSVSINYDRVLVIGWEKSVYDTMLRVLRSYKASQEN
jgi:hypothetical protein